MSRLEDKLDELIAKQERVSPQEVTLDFIRSMRDSKGDQKYDFTTRMGGFQARPNLRVVTREDSAKMIKTAYSYLDRFAKKAKKA